MTLYRTSSSSWEVLFYYNLKDFVKYYFSTLKTDYIMNYPFTQAAVVVILKVFGDNTRNSRSANPGKLLNKPNKRLNSKKKHLNRALKRPNELSESVSGISERLIVKQKTILDDSPTLVERRRMNHHAKESTPYLAVIHSSGHFRRENKRYD